MSHMNGLSKEKQAPLQMGGGREMGPERQGATEMAELTDRQSTLGLSGYFTKTFFLFFPPTMWAYQLWIRLTRKQKVEPWHLFPKSRQRTPGHACRRTKGIPWFFLSLQ